MCVVHDLWTSVERELRWIEKVEGLCLSIIGCDTSMTKYTLFAIKRGARVEYMHLCCTTCRNLGNGRYTPRSFYDAFF